MSQRRENHGGARPQSIVGVILHNIPPEAAVVRVEYEGPRIALYSKNPAYFEANGHIIPDIVNSLKKRVVLRVDESVRKPEEEARETLASMLPRDAGLENMFFDEVTGEVTLDCRVPKLIDHQSLKEFDSTGWKLRVKKAPSMGSTTVQQIMHMLKSTTSERTAFLRESGERIFRERLLEKNEVRLTALGGYKEVGRSCMLVETNDSKVLLDAGMHPGARGPPDSYPRLDWLQVDLGDIDAIVLSHAHIDHSGFLPVLYKYGYSGPLYCTEPTLALITLLLTDALKISTIEGNRYAYEMKDIRAMMSHAITIPQGTVTDISPDIKLVFYNAGHILGSSAVHLHVGEGAHNVVYTGDFKFGRSLLLEPASFNFPRVETLIMESTYGNKTDVMPPREETDLAFARSINETLQGGGKVLIPVPAVGRAQEIMLVLDHYMRRKVLAETTIFIEGMIREATAIHLYYPEFLTKELKDRIMGNGENPFVTEYFTIVEHPSRRDEALSSGPAIIMATSGMLEGGPSVQYLQEIATDQRNKILFVSYQVQGTMGRRVLDGAKQVGLMDNGKMKIVDINCKVEKAEGFSGHSDYNQLIRYVAKLRPRLQRVILNHGERRKVESLADSVSRMFRIPVYDPAVLDSVKLY
ncbi:MAG: beta-CASP ribonuclease aCPSF1 [Nitrososphaerota archaeon]|nr:beta-CASP ribonuclease aCPSF1 [Nitrososphaerota archaeon]MDG6939596.1 beta-CASP ribonuclease aCPSF1 [Nitrososphaerota archaeon]